MANYTTTVNGMRPCTGCKQILPVSEFAATAKKGGNQLQSRCRECVREAWRKNVRPNTLASKRRWMKPKYGITHDHYDKLLAEQGGVCAICRQPETAKRNGAVKMLSVDHDHDTGIVRGLLCHLCNTGIGKFRDDPERLVRAAEYINELRLKVISA